MSSWPLISDFSRLLQRPQFAFRDPVLKQCTVELDRFGQPKPRSGNFATVYRGYGQDGRSFAIRVFNRRQDERLEHYQAISRYLEQRRVQGLVGFEYDERGIRSASDGKMYPLLTMEWVPGVTLFDWCRDRCRENYREALAIGAEAWLQLVRALRRNQIVHGDLQHGNILVSEAGHFKLVDYDCMGVPEVLGRRNLEIGLEPYQHPGRNAETTMFAGMDNYSALLIYVALKALSAAPHLWTTYVEQPGYDKLLFRKEDFENRAASPLYNELMNLPDEQVRNLTHYLFELRGFPLHDVPDIDEVLLWCLSLEELLKARDWDTAVALMDRMGEGEQIPQHLAVAAADARRRVECRKALEEAIRRGNEAEIMRYYVPKLLDDYPAAEPLVEQARTAAQVAPVLQTLATARKFQKWDVFRATWNANHALLAHRAAAKPFKTEMKRLLAADAVGKLVQDAGSSDEAVVRAWQYLASLGGHPTAAAYQPHVERLANRHRGLPVLKRLAATCPDPPTMEHDTKLARAWRDDYREWPPAQPYRQLCREARTRLRQIEKLRALSNHVTLEGEKEIYKLSRALPENYHPLMRDRVRQTRHRLRAFQELQQAVSPPRSDLAIHAAWQKLKKLGGREMLPDHVRERAELAERRAPLIETLQQSPPGQSAAERDARLLETWDEPLLNNCRDVDPLLPAYQVARRRRDLLDRLRRALSEADHAGIEQCLADPLLDGYPLEPELQAGIESARQQAEQQRVARRQRIVAALIGNRRAEFVREFDRELLREICEQFKHHQPVVSQWTESEVLPLESLGLSLQLAPPPAAEGAEPPAENGPPAAMPGGISWAEKPADPPPEGEPPPVPVCTIRWQWPSERFSDRCRLKVCPKLPKPHAHPDDVESLHDETITRRQWQEQGRRLELTWQAEWEGAEVVVWAWIDLGYQQFHSEPLRVGTLQNPARPAKRRWGIFG